MKITKQITNLLADGVPRSSVEMGKQLGLNATQIKTAICSLQKHSHVVRAPITYRLTPSGEAHAAAPVSRSEAARLRHNERQALYRERDKKREADGYRPTVALALDRRLAIESVWGGVRA